MPQEQALLPYINQAYGQNVQAPDMSTFQETFTKDSERKREEYKTATEIGIDLDAQSYKLVEGSLKKLLDDAGSMDVPVGSPEWNARKGRVMAFAAQAKEISDVTKGMMDQFDQFPDQMTYMKEVDGEVIDMGKQEYMNDIEAARNREYENPLELVNVMANINQNATKLPVGVQQGIQNLRSDAIKTSSLLVQAGRGEVRPVSVNSGNVTFEIETNADPNEVKEMVGTLRAQHGGSLAAQYRRTGGRSGNQGLTEEQYVDQNIADMMITAARQYQVRGDFSSRGRGGSGSNRQPRIEEFQTDMKAAIENIDVDQVLKYVAGAGFNGERTVINGQPYFRFFKSGQTATGAQTKQNVVEVPLEMRALEDFVVQNSKQIDRESLDAFERPEVDVSKKQATIDAGKQQRLDSFATQWAEDTSSKARKERVAELKEFLGVDWIGIDTGTFNDDIIVDGEKYRSVSKAVEAIKEKLGTQTPAETPQQKPKFN